MAFEREMEIARGVAARSGELALRHAARGVVGEPKADLSPVTVADRECERLIAAALDEAFPEDGLLGEEGALKKSASGRRWLIDPIDGTRDFIRGNPSWGVLLALEAGPEVVVGVCNLPVMGELHSAAKGLGAYRNDSRIHVSSITERSQSVLLLNGLNELLHQPFAPRLLEWIQQFWAIRSFGGCQDAMAMASGRAEAWIEATGEAWDLAPLKIINEEAGAVFFNFDGGSSIYGGNAGICVPALELELRRFVIGAVKPRAAGTLGPPERPLMS